MRRESPQRDICNRTLDRIRALQYRSVRDSQGCFWVEGVRNFLQAFDAAYAVESVIHSKILLRHGATQLMVRRLVERGALCVCVSPEQFRTVSQAEHASGIGAILRQRWTPIQQARPERGLCWLVVESLRNLGNLGTIVRTAEAVGAAGLICVGPACDPYDPAVVRASMGGVFHLDLVRASAPELAQWAHARGVLLVGLSPHAEASWIDLPTDRPVGLLLGEERQGLAPALGALCEAHARLPIVGRADSLNVAVAAGVMMYELVRRRGSMA